MESWIPHRNFDKIFINKQIVYLPKEREAEGKL